MTQPSCADDRPAVTPYSRDREVSISPGERAECHLCEKTRHCVTRYEMRTCRSCAETLLPSPGIL